MAAKKLFTLFSDTVIHGITLTAPGFYGPQFRQLFIPVAKPELQGFIRKFQYDKLHITNFEMETSALYGLGSILQHKMLTLCLIVANRINGDFLSNYKPKMQELTEKVLLTIPDTQK
jgi:uridine phosphorylase